MKITEIVDAKLNSLPLGYVFTYNDFDVEVKQKNAVLKYLTRLAGSNKIMKLSKGKFYKPESSEFGQVPIKRYQVVKDLLEKNGTTIGYITGYSAYNELLLTTQVSSSIQIATNKTKKSLNRGGYKISFILQKNTITKDNIPYLKLLDAIKYIKKIPDTTINVSVERLMSLLGGYSDNQLTQIIRLAMKYPPSTRALLGAMLETLFPSYNVEPLMKSLNGISQYNISVSEDILPNKKEWRIK